MAFTYTKRKDGRLMKRVSVNGKIQTLYSKDPKDLERQYIEAKYLDSKNIYLDDSITFKQFAKEWLNIHSAGKADGTVREYKYIVNNYLVKNLGNLKLKNIRKYDIQNIQKDLLENNHMELAQKVVRFAKAILNEAIECDYIVKNVALNIKSPKIIRNEKKILTDDEDKLLVECSSKHKHGLFFLLLRYTGMRKEEITALQINDIDLKNKIISINKAVSFIHNQAKIKSTKNKKGRQVPILDVVYTQLEQRLDYCKKNKIKYLFTKQTDNKTMLSDMAIRRMLDSFLLFINKTQIENHKKNNDTNNKKNKNKKDENDEELKEIKFTLHQLRHSYCTMLYYAGIGIKEAQNLMGHSSADMVYDIYTHLDSKKEDISNSLNNYIKI